MDALINQLAKSAAEKRAYNPMFARMMGNPYFGGGGYGGLDTMYYGRQSPHGSSMGFRMPHPAMSQMAWQNALGHGAYVRGQTPLLENPIAAGDISRGNEMTDRGFSLPVTTGELGVRDLNEGPMDKMLTSARTSADTWQREHLASMKNLAEASNRVAKARELLDVYEPLSTGDWKSRLFRNSVENPGIINNLAGFGAQLAAGGVPENYDKYLKAKAMVDAAVNEHRTAQEQYDAQKKIYQSNIGRERGRETELWGKQIGAESDIRNQANTRQQNQTNVTGGAMGKVNTQSDVARTALNTPPPAPNAGANPVPNAGANPVPKPIAGKPPMPNKLNVKPGSFNGIGVSTMDTLASMAALVRAEKLATFLPVAAGPKNARPNAIPGPNSAEAQEGSGGSKHPGTPVSDAGVHITTPGVGSVVAGMQAKKQHEATKTLKPQLRGQFKIK